MEVDCIPFDKTGYFSKLICDYLEEKQELKPFYNRFPSLLNFKDQIQEKSLNFSKDHRDVLVKQLHRQYDGFKASDTTLDNITSLSHSNTFTVVTGHQLNLFSGPLYFLYKIISTINLCEELSEAYPQNHFVPVYWMATEDHDFEEINFFNFQGKKIQWNTPSGGAVGRLNTEGLKEVFEVFSGKLGNSKNADELKQIFKNAYLEHSNLSDATRCLANKLFGEFGLVIIDGDDIELKKEMIPFMKKDIFEKLPFERVSASIQKLSGVAEDYKIQVNPREINYFYLRDDFRERIVQNGEAFSINNTDIQFTKQELEKEMIAHPERFSPNVIARPLYQEVILPNLCYIGGGGELAYWLELKDYFDSVGITFPMLLLRNSALVISKKQAKKVERLDLDISDLFLKQNSLINKKIRKISNINIDFSSQQKALENQFDQLYKMAEKTDKSFLGAVKAQEVKQKKGLAKLEQRLLRAQKRKLKDHVIRLTDLQNELFPNYSLQERQINFSEFFLEFGHQLIPSLKRALKPLQKSFLVLRD